MCGIPIFGGAVSVFLGVQNGVRHQLKVLYPDMFYPSGQKNGDDELPCLTR